MYPGRYAALHPERAAVIMAGTGETITHTINAIGPGITTNTFSGFVGISSLAVTTTNGRFPVMDNLTVQLSELPMPAAFWLFGSGLIGIIAIAR